MGILDLAAKAATPKLTLILAGALVSVIIGMGAWVWVSGVRLKSALADTAHAELRANMQASAAREWEAALTQARVDLSQCQAQWTTAQADAIAALARAQAERDAIAARGAHWQALWQSRPQTCDAALVAAENACPGLEGY